MSSLKENFWGPVTSTIDWCEENYVVSPYLAEFFNTVTNLGFVFFSLFGIYNVWKNKSSKAYMLAYMGVIFVGFGSWCFHMTLQYEMQLLDELPMIYVASIVFWLTYLADPDCHNDTMIRIGLVIYSAVITYSYIIINNPVFHQVAYGLLVCGVVLRSIVLLKKVPNTFVYEKPRMRALLWMSALGFIIAFILWNIDNQFCEHLKMWRSNVPFLIGSVSELHGWWHIGTALGVYYFIVFSEWVHPTLANSPKRYKLHWVGPLCYLRIVDNKKQE
ncbi:ceramidase [Mycotypha africana]|uniref:ceramidase n=1 Tax=Mycotypha africana TaxID=64632 RepID=UPI0022FFF445|nr:ceramidase [Mycotypha africana]KAI8984416.1 ceramidase [Mycotypha africana]